MGEFNVKWRKIKIFDCKFSVTKLCSLVNEKDNIKLRASRVISTQRHSLFAFRVRRRWLGTITSLIDHQNIRPAAREPEERWEPIYIPSRSLICKGTLVVLDIVYKGKLLLTQSLMLKYMDFNSKIMGLFKK